MLLSRWFRRSSHPTQGSKRPTRTFRPAVELLEDRTVPSAFGRGFPPLPVPASGPATHLEVIAPENVTSGSASDVLVEAEDASNRPASGYTGTVHFTSSDANATLPADYTFTASDHGRHTFPVTFQTTGSQTVTATDTTTSSITGQASTSVDAAGVVTHFGVFTLGRALAGFPTPVLVEALDASNQVVAGYTGTVHFTSTDGSATLPADYTFVASDNGSHLFSVTFAAAGQQTLTATDTSNSSITGSADARVVSQLLRPSPLFGDWASSSCA
jgi:hypothetical protein